MNKNEMQINSFCKNISALRARYRISKKEMAKILGIGIGSLNKLEKGIIPTRMSCTVLFRVGKFFDISLDKLLLDKV
ncbi:MAG: helix-turn-helix transcriptional regulator [Ruminococcaceae bacterium]|nr:helix-turn-helix transcriptional regulator [Oscillospiraceae bacterium]